MLCIFLKYLYTIALYPEKHTHNIIVPIKTGDCFTQKVISWLVEQLCEHHFIIHETKAVCAIYGARWISIFNRPIVDDPFDIAQSGGE